MAGNDLMPPSRTARDLSSLHKWATARAQTDPDRSARPLWAQIAAEVGAYLLRDTPARPSAGADLFSQEVPQ